MISETKKKLLDILEKVPEEGLRRITDFLDGGNPDLDSRGMELVWKCTSCGFLKPKSESTPERCPDCGASKEFFVLLEED